ncbi:MAG: hypothetical protein KAZ36_04415, partial [Bacteroidales bacterium]|nr:hypothetical protein [Bacteroidales bacterium]
MKDPKKTQKPAMRNVLIILLGFLGLGAIYGGGTLIISPSGELLGMPLSLLEHSPFNSFLVPGIILFSVLGIAPCLLIIALLKKPEKKFAERLNFFKDMHWSWSYSIYTGFALIIWIQIEMLFLQAVEWIHVFYVFLAVAIIFVVLLPQVRILYKK